MTYLLSVLLSLWLPQSLHRILPCDPLTDMRPADAYRPTQRWDVDMAILARGRLRR